jgi:hypothetical protein
MILLALMTALFAGQAQDERLSKLAGELGSADAVVRERAAKEFVVLGRPVLKSLKALERDAADPEVRLRAAAIVRDIVNNLRGAALKLDVSTDKPVYAPGELVTIAVRLKNVEDFPVTVYLGDGTLVENAQAEVLSGATPLRLVVPTYQVAIMGAIDVDEKRFRTIPPGESLLVHTLTFKERWDLKGKDPGLKASYTGEDKRPLEAGTHRARATFAWGRSGKKQAKPAAEGLALELYQFTPKAEALLSEAWQGALEGSVDFKVGKD